LQKRQASSSDSGRQTPSRRIGAKAAWESHNLTTLALDHTAFIDSIVDLIARDPADQVATTIIHDCTVRWGSSC